MDEYNPRQLSTFALTLFRKNVRNEDGSELKVGEWTGGFVVVRWYTMIYTFGVLWDRDDNQYLSVRLDCAKVGTCTPPVPQAPSSYVLRP